MTTTFIVIGDPHFKINNIQEVNIFIEKIEKLCIEKKPDFILCLGDLLDTHERLHTTPLNKAYDFIDRLRKISKTILMKGNHDASCESEFLTTNHWMNSMKYWENVVIVDKGYVEKINNHIFTFMPYVSPGRFEEALNISLQLETNNNINEESKGVIGENIKYNSILENTKNKHNIDWKESTCIFAHQEFFGCKMGAITSVIGDKWSLDYPHIISGHIHSKQKIQDNIYYIGSAMQNAFGESEDNIIAYVSFPSDEDVTTNRIEYICEEIDLEMSRKKIIYMDVDDIEDYKIGTNVNEDKIKLSITGIYDQFKSFKKTAKYKELIEKGIKVTFKPKKIIEKNKEDNETENKEENINEIISDTKEKFSNILINLVKNQKNPLVVKALDIILK